jgi:hypothetical protein
MSSRPTPTSQNSVVVDNGNTILRNKPIHMMIRPAVFALAEGMQRIRVSIPSPTESFSRIRGDQDDSSTGNDQEVETHHHGNDSRQRDVERVDLHLSSSSQSHTKFHQKRCHGTTGQAEQQRGTMALQNANGEERSNSRI